MVGVAEETGHIVSKIRQQRKHWKSARPSDFKASPLESHPTAKTHLIKAPRPSKTAPSAGDQVAQHKRRQEIFHIPTTIATELSSDLQDHLTELWMNCLLIEWQTR